MHSLIVQNIRAIRLIIVMSKNIINPYQRTNPYKFAEKPSSKLSFKGNSNNRRVQTEAFDYSDEEDKTNTQKIQFSIGNYKNFLPSKSSKKTNPPSYLQYKKQTLPSTQSKTSAMTSTLNRNTGIKTIKEVATSSKPNLVHQFPTGKNEDYRKHSRIRTQAHDWSGSEKISQIYSKLNNITVTKQKLVSNDPEKNYRVVETVGKGTFGVVYKAIQINTGETVAIKKVLQDKRYKNRQLQIMKMLHHPNLLQTKDYYYTKSGGEQFLNVVIDYFQDNLYNYNRSFHRKGEQIPPLLLKVYAYQMFKSINYLAALSIAHRDIKPHNILIDSKQNRLVICDFGSAKQLVATQSNLAYICSRCYRAPELIFGATDYTTQIDMWSIGCVIVEMINGEPPFMGDSQIDQLIEIIKILGTPSKATALQMNKDYDIKEYKYPIVNAKQWRKILKPKTDPLLVDLVSKVMQYSPKLRLTPFEAMCHPYFDQIRNKSKYQQIVAITGCRDLLQFGKEQSSKEKSFKEKLIPTWYK